MKKYGRKWEADPRYCNALMLLCSREKESDVAREEASTPARWYPSPKNSTRITTSSGNSYFSLQIATSSAPITEGGPIRGYRLPPAGEALLATIALGFFALTVRSREESEESKDSVGATLNLLDLTLLPMEEESGERPDSVLISRTGGRNDL
ncbi:hypothetical protein HID58_037917 [Brassica napus]|uniref:Uncharacterized protein n=1 Tax=Brassica napus TaxID=3708 RepID=A0ABQ8BMR7_BRANA|nr:hypothetical protein HID58_037917 [Brassica napus]